MNREQVHDLMENELRCVQRGNYCDRDCAKCPLVKDDKELIEAYGYVIKALEQEPCEDAIRRADAEALFRNARSKLNPSDYKTADEFNTRDLMLLNAEQFIHLLPSVRPQEPKTGHWITEIKSNLRGDMWPTNPKCSECGGEPYFSKTIYSYNFCPYCGAKMEVEE